MSSAIKPAYWELLRDPRWQQKRLRIMERDKFECRWCGCTTKTLNVHHTYYEKGFMPWEYPDESLRTFCEECHQNAQERMKVLHREIGMIGDGDIETVIGFIRGIRSRDSYAVDVQIESYECADGIGKLWGIDADSVMQEASAGPNCIPIICGAALAALKEYQSRRHDNHFDLEVVDA